MQIVHKIDNFIYKINFNESILIYNEASFSLLYYCFNLIISAKANRKNKLVSTKFINIC